MKHRDAGADAGRGFWREAADAWRSDVPTKGERVLVLAAAGWLLAFAAAVAWTLAG